MLTSSWERCRLVVVFVCSGGTDSFQVELECMKIVGGRGADVKVSPCSQAENERFNKVENAQARVILLCLSSRMWCLSGS